MRTAPLRMLVLLLGAGVLAGAPACVVVRGVNDAGCCLLPDAGPPDAGPPDAGPPETPPPDGGGGGEVVFAGSGRSGDPGLAVLWLVHVDPGVANLADRYDSLVAATDAMLTDAGFQVRQTAVGSLDDGTLLWARDSWSTYGLAEVLRYQARSDGADGGVGCATDALFRISVALDQAPLALPPELAAGLAGTEYPFAEPAAALVVGFLDSAARPSGLDSSACEHAGYAPTQLLGADPAQWARWSAAPPLPRAHVRFLISATPETENFEEMQRRCLALPGFPESAADVLAPSPEPFFDPLAQRLTLLDPGLAIRTDLCDSLELVNWRSEVDSPVHRWAEALAAEVR